MLIYHASLSLNRGIILHENNDPLQNANDVATRAQDTYNLGDNLVQFT